jgi:uncharacterized protein with PIN domain
LKFIADVMLGRLAKRLRLLGFDVLYDRTLDDNELIRLSLEQDRVILTRNHELAIRPLAANHLVIQSDPVRQQIEQVLDAFRLEAQTAPLTRCSVCNETLRSISKQEAEDLVPSHVFEQFKDFLRCSVCGGIYWKGTHIQRMKLNAAFAHSGL